MSYRSWHTGVTVLSVLVGISAFAASAPCEDLLKKAGDEYLGWKIPTDRFEACDGTLIDIGDGRVERTSRKCTVPGPPSARWGGTVVKVDYDASHVDVRNSAGTVKRVHWDSSTRWTKGTKTGIDQSRFREGERVICLGKYEHGFLATRIDVRPPE